MTTVSNVDQTRKRFEQEVLKKVDPFEHASLLVNSDAFHQFLFIKADKGNVGAKHPLVGLPLGDGIVTGKVDNNELNYVLNLFLSSGSWLNLIPVDYIKASNGIKYNL